MKKELQAQYLPKATYTLVFGQYSEGQTAIRIFGNQGPEMTATINIPTITLHPNEVIIKDYSENAGILASLVEAGVISKPIQRVKTGHAMADICLLTPETLKYIKS